MTFTTRPTEQSTVHAWDTETHLIKPGLSAPKLVCLTTDQGELFTYEDALDWIETKLQEPDAILVGHNVFYDLGIVAAERPHLIRLIFRAIDEGRIRCTMQRQMMIDNAHGDLKFIEDDEGNLKKQDFSLARIIYRYTKKFRKKGTDTFRLNYWTLEGVPANDYPPDARKYAVDDAIDTRTIHDGQEEIVAPEGIPGDNSQIKAGWALHLTSMRGARTELAAVERLKVELGKEYADQETIAKAHGFIRDNGTRNMKAIKDTVAEIYKARGLAVPMSDSGKNVSTSRETLKESEHPGLLAVSECVRIGKVLSTYVPVLESGAQVPIVPRYNAIIETFRTSCAKPNLQNPPRSGGVRECFVPRPGFVHVFCDFDTLEMRTLAQVCLDLFGYSFLAESLRAGRDLHVDLAADMLGISYEEAMDRYEAGDPQVAEARQFCKIGNYGFGGGMGPEAFQSYAKGYGIEVSLAQAAKLHKAFRTKWREMNDYFAYCSALCDGGEAAHVQFVRSGLVRGQVRYTAVCNGFFQHLAAMGAKEALYETVRECYLNEHRDGSPSELAGCRPWLFAHDEIGMEIPYLNAAQASAAAYRLQTIMEEVMQRWCPDVPISAGVVMCRRWYKGAKEIVENGVLIPSKPVKVGKKTKWVADPMPMAA